MDLQALQSYSVTQLLLAWTQRRLSLERSLRYKKKKERKLFWIKARVIKNDWSTCVPHMSSISCHALWPGTWTKTKAERGRGSRPHKSFSEGLTDSLPPDPTNLVLVHRWVMSGLQLVNTQARPHHLKSLQKHFLFLPTDETKQNKKEIKHHLFTWNINSTCIQSSCMSIFTDIPSKLVMVINWFLTLWPFYSYTKRKKQKRPAGVQDSLAHCGLGE